MQWTRDHTPFPRMDERSMAEESKLLSAEEVVLVNVKKLRSLGVTQGDDEIRQVLVNVDNDFDKALAHLQANGKENHEMEVETVPDKEEEIVVVEDHFGDGLDPPMEGGGADLPPPYEERPQAEETSEKVPVPVACVNVCALTDSVLWLALWHI